MTAKELRAWIGKEIEWDTQPDQYGCRDTDGGILLEVKGRNLRVDRHGSEDWLWIPKMMSIRLKP